MIQGITVAVISFALPAGGGGGGGGGRGDTSHVTLSRFPTGL